MRVRVWRFREGATRKHWRTGLTQPDGPNFPADYQLTTELDISGSVEDVREAAYSQAKMTTGDIVMLGELEDYLLMIAAPFGWERVKLPLKSWEQLQATMNGP